MTFLPEPKRARKANKPSYGQDQTENMDAINALVNISSDDLVTIRTPSGGKYTALGSLLGNHSAYFKQALSGPWQESGSREIKLDDDVEDDVFKLVIKWVYTQQLSGDGARESVPENLPWIRLCDALVLAHYLLMPTLEASILALMKRKVETTRELIHISPRIWTETPEYGQIWDFFIGLTSNLDTAKRISKKSVKLFTPAVLMASYQKLVNS